MSHIAHEPSAEVREPMSWVRTRMQLDAELMEWIRHGFSLIAVGFGSFAFLEGIAGTLGEGEGSSPTEPSRIFSLIATAVGVLLVAIALKHNRNMVDFVNADEFGAGEIPELPNKKREEYLAGGAIIIEIVSFVALLFLRKGPATVHMMSRDNFAFQTIVIRWTRLSLS